MLRQENGGKVKVQEEDVEGRKKEDGKWVVARGLIR